MSAATATPVVETTMDEIEVILARAKEGPLSEEERELLHSLAESYLTVLSKIEDKKTTIERLRRMVFGAKTETKANVEKQAGKAPAGGSEKKPAKKKRKRKGHGRIPAEAYVGAEKVKVPHESLMPGDRCRLCPGTVYDEKQKPAVSVRIRGSAPFVATVYEQQRLRCGLCGEVFTARLPAEAGTGKKFDETVASMVALLRYGNGLPMNRIENLQKVMGMPFPSSTQWELVAEAAKKIAAAHTELIRQAAQGAILYNDDTPMKILEFMVEQRKQKERGEKPPERTGTFTSGIVSERSDGQKIVLYFTGKRHAGENLTEVLKKRGSGLDPPIQMCDALDRNVPKGLKTILSNCIVHARRGFVDVAAGFPDEVAHVIDELALVYQNDDQAKVGGMSAEERLGFHQAASGPIMNRLKDWMDAQIAEKKVEPNSGLGKAIAYCTKRWEKLTLFLREPGAPLDNSITERMLKKAIIHRKNSLFYKTQNGAVVGDLYMALIATAKLANANPFDYLNELQRHAEEVTDDPAAWMPWNYRETLDRAATTN